MSNLPAIEPTVLVQKLTAKYTATIQDLTAKLTESATNAAHVEALAEAILAERDDYKEQVERLTEELQRYRDDVSAEATE